MYQSVYRGRKSRISELEAQIQEKLAESDSDDYYCELEEYVEMAPQSFEFFL